MTLKKCLLLIAAFAAGYQVWASEPVDTYIFSHFCHFMIIIF